eukprot:gene9796-13178_t
MVAIMIEYMDGGSLQDIVDHGGCDDEVTLANIAVQALKGLDFLHNCSQLHRDLKPGNFLISHRGEVKVADLGIMKQMGSNTNSGPSTRASLLPKTNTFVGTATYMSPERIDGKDYSYPSDVWAFGLSLLALALGRLPIETQGGYWTILHNIRDAPSPTIPSNDTRFSSELKEFIDLCLKRKPEERWSCKQLLKHPFLRKACPEDLTYAQSYARGKNELHSIILAVLAHIKQLKYDALSKKLTKQINSIENEEEKIQTKIFGDLLNSDELTILRRVLFGEDYLDNNNMFTKKENNNLARSTRSNASTVVNEAQVSVEDGSDTPIGGNNNNIIDPNIITTTNNNNNNNPRKMSKLKVNRFIRPRLHNLARQLYLPLEMVVNEAKEFCDTLSREMSAVLHEEDSSVVMN